MVPIRVKVVLTLVFMVKVWLPVPVAGVTVTQEGWSEEALHVVFDVRGTELSPPAGGASKAVTDGVRMVDAAWVTARLVVLPPPDTVMVPVREAAELLAVAVMVRVWELDPVVGVTLSQES
jgi:hypothetical protein